ncbi:MAG: hypothetical protein ACO3FE_21535, partial [Planctomycetaceae bacterium]
PADKLTSDPTPLLASVTGPEPIAEIAMAAPEISEAPAMTIDVASLESLPPVAGELGSQLIAAKTTLMEIRTQLEENRADAAPNEAALIQALVDAGRIAEGIERPSTEILEARVFLKAALERVQATSTSAPATSVATVSSTSMIGLRNKLADVNTSLAEMTKRCESIEAEYTNMDSQISDLTARSTSLKTEYITVAEQLKHLSAVSATLEKQLNAAAD